MISLLNFENLRCLLYNEIHIMNNIVPTKPLLILLYGYPGAGKTFFARQLSEHFQAAHVQGDRIRFELFSEPQYDKQENEIVSHLVDYMTEEFLKAGISVIYDVNAIRASQRRALRDMARSVKAEPFLIWLQIDIESAFSRVANRDRRHVDDKYTMKLDRTTFDNLSGHMQNPGRDEDYVVISGKHVFKTQFNTILRKMRETGVLKVDEANSRIVKPGLVNLIPSSLPGRVDLSRRNIVIR